MLISDPQISMYSSSKLMSSYYEWLTPKSGGKKVPHYVKRPDGNIMLFAALYDHVKLEGILDLLVLVTKKPCQLFLHCR